MTDLVVTELDSRVLIVQMNRPDKKNALKPEMYAAMTAAINRAEEDSAIRCVLITGQSDCFTAGNDLQDFLDVPPDSSTHDDPVFGFLGCVGSAKIPLVAAVGGVAVGVGTTMLLHCDLVYAATNAKFMLPFINLAVVPEAASSMLLPRIVGYQRAAELLMLGEPFDADHAYKIGIVNEVCSPNELFDKAMTGARKLCEKPPGALRSLKELLKREAESVQDRMKIENELFAEHLKSPESKEAMNAFFERRKPDFSQFGRAGNFDTD